jgi:hypothetical protein
MRRFDDGKFHNGSKTYLNRREDMKKIALLAITVLLLCLASACAEDTKDNITITTRAETTGTNITLSFEKGERYTQPTKVFGLITMDLTPQIAVWIEDTDGRYVDTLYVTEKAGTQGWMMSKKIRRPESLPCWSHRRGVVYPDGLYMPTKENPLTDAVTAASPAGNFRLMTRVPKEISRFVIMAEVNNPGDYNEAYLKTADEGSPNYSRGGVSGQPSIVYAATVDLSSKPATVELVPVGHGSPDGADGVLYPDLSGLTTAKDIIKRITVTAE